MRTVAVITAALALMAAGYTAWQQQQMQRRLEEVQAAADDDPVVADLSEEVAELDEANAGLRDANNNLARQVDDLRADVAQLESELDEGSPKTETEGVFQTFRGPVTIEDIYFELVDDEFEGISNSRIDRIDCAATGSC